MANNNNPRGFDLHSLVNNHDFNFINTILKNDDIDNSTSGNISHSPYSDSTFQTSYIDLQFLSNIIQNNNNISILSFNIQSLAAKYSELKDLIILLSPTNSCPDIICLQEIWSVMDADQFPLPGYQPLIYTTRNNSQGGGGWHLCQIRSPFQNLQN